MVNTLSVPIFDSTGVTDRSVISFL
jgi:hypothetical protein